MSQAKVNDLYLNTSTGNVYQCTAGGAASGAKWAYTGCLMGPQGKTGATGATGPTGAAGKDATVNGVNALTLTASGGLTSSQSGSTLAIDGSGLQPKRVSISLSSSGWSKGLQTMTVPGISASETE